jgi:hypothetical protein
MRTSRITLIKCPRNKRAAFKTMLDAKFPQTNPRYFVILGNAS